MSELSWQSNWTYLAFTLWLFLTVFDTRPLRPFFTSWIMFVNIVILIVTLAAHSIAPIGFSYQVWNTSTSFKLSQTVGVAVWKVNKEETIGKLTSSDKYMYYLHISKGWKKIKDIIFPLYFLLGFTALFSYSLQLQLETKQSQLTLTFISQLETKQSQLISLSARN